MKTPYWQASVTYYREDGSWGSCTAGAQDQSDSLAVGFETASYYLLVCGYQRVEVQVEQYCGECQGFGEVVTKRTRFKSHTAKCKACNGHVGALQVLGPFPARIHENASLCQSTH